MKAKLSKRRVAFSSFIEEVKEQIVDHAPLIKETFEGYAREFLLEDCDLPSLPTLWRHEGRKCLE